MEVSGPGRNGAAVPPCAAHVAGLGACRRTQGHLKAKGFFPLPSQTSYTLSVWVDSTKDFLGVKS